MTCPDVGIVSSTIQKVCCGVFSMISSKRVPFAVIFVELLLQNCVFCGAKSKSKQSASLRYFCTDWCLAHHRFSDFRIFQTGLPLEMSNHLFAVYLTFPPFWSCGHVDLRHQTITWNHDDWDSDYNFLSYILHRFYLRFFRDVWQIWQPSKDTKRIKRLRSRVECDSDKGKGSSNYRHIYIYI